MNSTEALREFTEKYKTSYSHSYMDDTTGLEIHQSDNVDLMLSDLTALISEGYYPKQFVEWATNNAECDGDGKWLVYSIAATIDSPKVCKYETALLTTDELFNYWKENER